jgi:hypothetical protein
VRETGLEERIAVEGIAGFLAFLIARATASTLSDWRGTGTVSGAATAPPSFHAASAGSSRKALPAGGPKLAA